jgi:hypothetical protein
MPAAVAVALNEAQWEQLWAIIARFSHGKPAIELTVELPAPPSDKEVRGLLRMIRPCRSYATAWRNMWTFCLENGHSGILDTVSAMVPAAQALLTKHLPWPPDYRQACTCQNCKCRRDQDKAIADFARRLAAEYRGFGLETAVSSAISGVQSFVEDCRPMMAVMCDLVELYLEHLKLPKDRAQQMLGF